MLLMLKEIIRRSGTDDLGFFESAYYWKFKKQVDVFGDVLAFRTQGQIPHYISEYIKHLEGLGKYEF